MIEFLKKYWFLITFVVGPLLTAIYFLFSLSGRIYDSPLEKIEHQRHVKEAVSPAQQQISRHMDSLNNASAIKTRATRLKRQYSRDSTQAIHDSIMLDYVQKNADQIFQIRQERQ